MKDDFKSNSQILIANSRYNLKNRLDLDENEIDAILPANGITFDTLR